MQWNSTTSQWKPRRPRVRGTDRPTVASPHQPSTTVNHSARPGVIWLVLSPRGFLRRFFSKVVQKYGFTEADLPTALLHLVLVRAHASIWVSRPRHVNLTRMNMRRRSRRTTSRGGVSAQAHTSLLLCCTACPASTCCECTRSSSTRGRWARRTARRDAVVERERWQQPP